MTRSTGVAPTPLGLPQEVANRVFVEGASMPPLLDLPDDLKPLVRRQALEVSHNRFRADSKQLIDTVERALEKTTVELRNVVSAREKERLEVGRRETEAKERLEAERRQKEEQEQM
jgi:hypothetical protein